MDKIPEALNKILDVLTKFVDFLSNTPPRLIALVFGLAALAWAIPVLWRWYSAEISQDRKAQRDFGTETAKKVTELANKHYWAIANATGTLNLGLDAYLQEVELRMYLWFDKNQDASKFFRQELSELATKHAQETLPNLARVVWALDYFQFRGSNGYLLVHQSSDRHLRRLYNLFRSNLPTPAAEKKNSPDADRGDITTKILEILRNADKDHMEGALNKHDMEGALNSVDWSHEKEIVERWTSWLREDLPSVVEASVALQAFARLLQHELAWLYVDWYRDKSRWRRWLPRRLVQSDELAYLSASVAKHRWPQILKNDDVETLLLAQEQSDFFRSLKLGFPDGSRSHAAAGPGPQLKDSGETASGPPKGPKPGPVGAGWSAAEPGRVGREPAEAGWTAAEPEAGWSAGVG